VTAVTSSRRAALVLLVLVATPSAVSAARSGPSGTDAPAGPPGRARLPRDLDIVGAGGIARPADPRCALPYPRSAVPEEDACSRTMTIPGVAGAPTNGSASSLPVPQAGTSATATPSPYRTRVLSHGGRDFTLKLIGRRGGNYTLCVRSPHRINHRLVLCHGFRLVRKAADRYVGTVRWGKSFRFQGPGHYRVSWYRPATRRLLGPRKPFETGVCPPQPQIMDGVWKPHPRLRIIDSCRTVLGTVRDTPHLSRHDGDLPFHFSRVGLVEFLARDRGHLRRGRGGIGPRNPRAGEHLRLTGVYVCDGFHGPMGHTELHPIFRVTYVGKDRTYISGPQYGGTPNVNLSFSQFHPCP
jgi:hypothetical protein